MPNLLRAGQKRRHRKGNQGKKGARSNSWADLSQYRVVTQEVLKICVEVSYVAPLEVYFSKIVNSLVTYPKTAKNVFFKGLVLICLYGRVFVVFMFFINIFTKYSPNRFSVYWKLCFFVKWVGVSLTHYDFCAVKGGFCIRKPGFSWNKLGQDPH